jgi:hypothetical protein
VKGKAIHVSDVASVRELPYLPIDEGYPGYTFGYNRTLLANRVHDILTAVAAARDLYKVKSVELVGFGKAGPWVALAAPLCGDAVGKVAADMDQFRFENILSLYDEMLQPGALRYGGLPALTALNAPRPLYLHNTQGVDPDGWIAAAYRAAGKSNSLQQMSAKATNEQVVGWLLK